MQRIELILFCFFLIGLAVGMIVSGIYNVYEFNRANKELIEAKTTCECGQVYKGISKLNISVNFT